MSEEFDNENQEANEEGNAEVTEFSTAVGELVEVNTKTNTKGKTQTVIKFVVDNMRWGKIPSAVHDLQGTPCMVSLNENQPEDELDLDNE